MSTRKTTDRRIKFSDRSITHLKAQEKSIEYFDAERKSGEGAFGIRVSPKGKKAWFAMYKNQDGKIRRYPLQDYPQTSLAEARKKCNAIIAANATGTDMQSEKQRRKAAPNMNDLWKAYQESLDNRKKPKSARWRSEEESRWLQIIQPAIGNLKVEDVSPAHLTNILVEKAKTAPVSANRLHGLLRQLFKPALGNGWITVHPMQWIEKPGGSESSRKRILTEDEIKTLWPYFDKVSHNARDAFKLGLYTAQRPGEILKMKWDDIDLDKCVWIQESNKTDVVHIVPLSHQVVSILLKRKKWLKERSEERGRDDLKTSQWVFPSRYNTTRAGNTGERRFTSTKDARRKIQEMSGIIGWTSHDLRRTARTLMSSIKIKHHIRERCLNHSQDKISETYDRYDYLQEKSDALQKLANKIDNIRGIKSNTGEIHKLVA